MRKLCLFFFLLAGTCLVRAQDLSGQVSGAVLDAAGKPLPAVTITVFNLADSALVKSAVTDREGKYEFERLPQGRYYLLASFVGYESSQGTTFGINADQLQVKLPAISLSPKAQSLSGVTVTATRPFIESKIDKTVVNVDASPTNAGATALEVLEKSPGIMVNNDGVISLRGKSGVIVMMDGKPTFLSPTDLANLLRNLPASAIDQIEIMTNPSARFDASGNSGVINIKTKKGKTAGFNGSIMVGLTGSFFTNNHGVLYVMPKSQNSFNWNYRRNKINFFGNYNPNFFRGRSVLEITRRVLDENKNTLGYNDVVTNFKFGNNNHTLKLGLDVFADGKNTFGVVVSGFTFSGRPTPSTVTTSSDHLHAPRSHMISKTRNHNTFRNLTANFNYRHQFDSAGRELTADLDYIAYDNRGEMSLVTELYDGGWNDQGDLELRGVLPSSIQIYSFRSDYVHPFRKNGRLEAGIKSSFVKNDNEVDYERWDGGKWIADTRSNHFLYDENINAAYVNLNTQAGKWSFQGGLRLENTVSKGYQVTNDSAFRRDFTNLFPSAFVSYEINPAHRLTVSYSRRINRPNYQDLNPFIFFLDSLSYRKGNPFLTPQFTHNVELSHAFKSKFITTLNYNNTSDVIAQILKPDGNLVYLTSENVARFRNIGLSLTLPFKLASWWNLNLFTNIYNNYYEGFYEGKPLQMDYTSFMVNMTNTFTVSKGFTLEMSGFYRARGVDQLTRNDPMYVLNFGAQKQVLKGKGTLRMNLRDPFWIQRYSGVTQYELVDTRVKNRWDNRQLTFSFNYRFGNNGQSQQQRRRNSAAQDEMNRVGQGQ